MATEGKRLDKIVIVDDDNIVAARSAGSVIDAFGNLLRGERLGFKFPTVCFQLAYRLEVDLQIFTDFMHLPCLELLVA